MAWKYSILNAFIKNANYFRNVILQLVIDFAFVLLKNFGIKLKFAFFRNNLINGRCYRNILIKELFCEQIIKF